jgi:hypothetical protein
MSNNIQIIITITYWDKEDGLRLVIQLWWDFRPLKQPNKCAWLAFLRPEAAASTKCPLPEKLGIWMQSTTTMEREATHLPFSQGYLASSSTVVSSYIG